MSTEHTPFARLSAALKARGFTYQGQESNGWWKFTGAVEAAGATREVFFSVDPRGRSLPRFRAQLPPDAPKVLPHIGAQGSVCYALKGSLVLDIFDVAGQALACFDRAVGILDLSLRGQLRQDLEDEFFVYWQGETCLLDIDRAGRADLTVMFTAHFGEESGIAVVTNDVERTRAKLRAMNLEAEPATAAVAFKVQSKAKPRPLVDNWPPGTVSALLRWQGLLDPRAKQVLERRLLSAAGRGQRFAACVIATPLTHYAFWVKFADPPASGPRTGARERLYASKVHPFTDFRIDDAYIAQRNTPGRPTLAGKKIVLVGCGTIGGFLAELLVKNGAGMSGGQLLLVDPDTLGPQNVGRHRLGFNRVLQNKAQALRDELSASAPSSNIQAAPAHIEDVDVGGADLLVDATGEEGVGHALTAADRRGRRFVPTLTVWVEGPGVAVRALLRAEQREGCTRCMVGPQGERLYPATHEPVPVELAGHGCESLFVPFPATASVQAACLAAEMVSDWVAGVAAPHLRTVLLRRNFTLATADCDIAKAAHCPACDT